MRFLLVPLLFVLMSISPSGGSGHTSAEGGPHLIASSINGTLEIDRPGAVWIDIKNDVNASTVEQNALGQKIPIWLQPGYGDNATDAIGISVELQPKDARIEMLSGPQLAGSLIGGENRTLEFNMQANGMIEPGVYPADLSVSYRKLSEVLTSGVPELPDVTFQFENVSETIPAEINIVQGPRISVEKVWDGTSTGKESALDLVFANSGDLPASDLRVQVLPETPFSSGDGPVLLGSLGPGLTATAKFRIKTDNGTAPGVYALQIGVDYRDGKSSQKEELAALVPVKNQSETGFILVPAAGALVLACASYVVFRTYRGRFKRKRKRRW